MGKFFEELQSLDERTKSRILIVTTVVIMVVVVYFWLGYFNSIVSSAAQPVVADASQPGIFQRMGSGMATMFRAFGNLFKGSSHYTVKPL